MIFSAPLFLIGLAAIAIPIAVHLFNFRRYKKVYFSNVDTIEQIQTESRRQSTLRQLLIMVARILAIIFLVLAFAQPIIPNRNQMIAPGGSLVSVYVDNSFSMEAADADGSLLDKAKQKAAEIVNAYQPTDRFQLLTNDMEGRQFHWLSREEFLAELDAVEASSVTPTLSALALRQYDFLHSANSANRFAYYLSDFQKAVADFEQMVDDSTINAIMVPIGAMEQDNIYIDTIIPGAPVYYVGNSFSAEVTLRNDGDANMEKVPLSLYVDGQQKAVASVDLPAHSSATTTMHFTIDHSGLLDCRIETTDYPVTFDDSYYFSLNIRDRINLLIVEGGDINDNLRRLFADDSAMHCTTMSYRQLDIGRFAGQDVIIIDELPTISTGLAQTLQNFVEEGGTVVLVPAAKIEEQAYNSFLTAMGAPRMAGFSTARVSANRCNLTHPLYLNVFDMPTATQQDDMEMPTVSGHYRTAADGGTLRTSLITLVGGDDLLTHIPRGEGNLYLFTAPLRDAYTDFVHQALFVPTLYNMALYSLRPAPFATTLDHSGPVALTQRYDVDAGAVRLAGPSDFEEIPDLRQSGAISLLVPHGSIRHAGNYRLTLDGKAVEALSFNYSRRESQTHCMDAADIADAIKDYNLHHSSVVRQVDKPLDSYLREQMEGRSLWRWCIVGCLLMLALEVLLMKLDWGAGKKSGSAATQQETIQ